MTSEQSKALKPGQRVAWQKNASDRGTIVFGNWNAVQIKWDSGKASEHHHNEMGDVDVAK